MINLKLKSMNKIREIIAKVLASKIGKFIFEFINVVALVFLTIYMFAHVKILFGIVVLFCTFSNILILINKYKKKRE